MSILFQPTSLRMIQLFVAPAAAGKTTYVLNLVRGAAQGLQKVPCVLVPTHLQALSLRRRLAAAGGAIGVRVMTFDQLYAECLQAAGRAYTELGEPVQYRLIRSVVDTLDLDHYKPLVRRPGFIQVLQDLIGELKAARIEPEAFSQAVDAMGREPRLQEIAQIYASYQARLQAFAWADRAGLGWLAVEALENNEPPTACRWPLLVVDGFDNLTGVQLGLLEALAGRVDEMVITLTGELECGSRPLVCGRFEQTRKRLEELLNIAATSLRSQSSSTTPALVHLESGLFRSHAARTDAKGAIELVEAPNREAEVRAALRWLKACIVHDAMRPGEVALLARHIPAYRTFILQTAAEFGLPIHLMNGLPLKANPAVAALVNLLRLVLPRSPDDPELLLPRRPVIEAWRSPYFDWSALSGGDTAQTIDIRPGDADVIDRVARWGRVIGGHAQWQEVLDRLSRLPEPSTGDVEQDEEQGLPTGVPRGAAARALRDKFDRFVRRLLPPDGEHTYREFVQWLEALIGPDPAIKNARFPDPEDPSALKIVSQARQGPRDIADRDVAALLSLKDVLRGLVWAEEALAEGTETPAGRPVRFTRFFDELVGAVDAATYQLPWNPDREGIIVADIVQARGVPFRAVAVLGLAEGEFPATIGEDPFLRDADRQRLGNEFGLPLDLSTESAEVEFFYETVTRPWERLLLTRPRLADNGALWQASPFWEEVRRLVDVKPETLTSESSAPPHRAASWPELMESLAVHQADSAVQRWAEKVQPERYASLQMAAQIFDLRRHGAPSDFDGDLSADSQEFASRFGPDHVWSASRLESYRTCPFLFYVGHVLGLEPREEPAEGLDARQLGNIYHHILEQVYQAPGVADPDNPEQVLAGLLHVARPILDAAPERESFRETAWWRQTRDEILANIRRSLVALADLPGGYIPFEHEAPFGLRGQPPLLVEDGQDRFLLHGYIDRVDRTPGHQVRVIDYKTAGPSTYSKSAVAKGKKLQLPLYALAARDALKLGEPAEGFYWHVQHAEPSGFTLSNFDGGPRAAMELAAEKAWEAVRAVRDGQFVPQPVDGDCPAYCPAAAFCWHYRPRFGG